jgi:methylmalonyl-CoA mutase C-terminal domain/subunit
VRQALDDQGLSDVLLFGGGIIPDVDVKGLLDGGVAAVFGPGTPTGDIARWLGDALDARGERSDI